LLLINCDEIGDDILTSIAHRPQLPSIRNLSVHGCTRITSKGVASLGHYAWLHALRELDLSNNRSIDDRAVMSIYTALRATSADHSNNQDKLIIYVFRTGVTERLEPIVADLITLSY